MVEMQMTETEAVARARALLNAHEIFGLQAETLLGLLFVDEHLAELPQTHAVAEKREAIRKLNAEVLRDILMTADESESEIADETGGA